MNQEIKERWVAALRSDEFTQGKRSLRPTQDTFCCLGVLCELYHRETGKGAWTNATELFSSFTGESDAYHWAGIIGPGSKQFILVALAVRNDQGDTFNQIADFIDATL